VIRCSIDGCDAQTGRDVGSAWICSTHWRRHCPPRSLRRRAYHRFYRKAKQHGWTDKLRMQYWRFWEMLVRLANAAEKTDKLDMTEINAMFGWTDD
jgi:hypothetical protein